MKKTFVALLFITVSLSACNSKPIVPDKNDAQKVQEYNKVSKSGDTAVDPVHGEEVSMWYGALAGVEGTNANGVGFIRQYKDGTTVVTINMNVLPLTKPAYFSVQLQNDATGTVIDVGELSSIIGDARHSAKLETKEDASSSLKVVMLKHATAGDAGVVAGEGILKMPTVPTK